MNAVLIGFLTTGTTLAVTVALFTAEWIRRRIVAYRDNRRAIITRVLDTLDRAFRGYARKTVLPIGTGVEVEYTILLPRLLVDLPKRDRVVATWVAAEIQRMQSQTSDTKAFAVAAETSSKLVDWYHHDLNRDWFTKALRNHPESPRRVRGLCSLGRMELCRRIRRGGIRRSCVSGR